MRYRQFSDRQLIELYCQGDEKSFEILLNRHQEKVFSYIVMMVRDRELANDIFQETFFKVIRTLKTSRYNDEGKFLPWVMRIAHNLIIDHFRKAKKLPTVPQFYGTEENEFDIFSTISNNDRNVEDDLVRNQIHKDVKKLVNLLPDEQRQVVIMRHYMDMSFKEIADVTNVSINTALGRMRYALMNMRRLIENNNMVMS